MERNELKKLAINRKNKLSLRMVGEGLEVDTVFGDRVLVKLVVPSTEMDEFEAKGLVIPQAAREANTPMASTGIVVMVGTEVTSDVKMGDMLMFSRYGGSDYQINKEDYRVLDMREIMCRLRPADPEAPLVVAENE